MVAAKGILTARGGMTSHAAVVARHGHACVCGCGALSIDLKAAHPQSSADHQGRRGRHLHRRHHRRSLRRWPAARPSPRRVTSASGPSWTGRTSSAGSACAPTPTPPNDAASGPWTSAPRASACAAPSTCSSGRARAAVQQMILAKTNEAREPPSPICCPLQREDFVGIFKAMKGLPVTVRLIDPPLHEFVPSHDERRPRREMRARRHRRELRGKMKHARRCDELHEHNPMLGLRGCAWPSTSRASSTMQIARHHRRRHRSEESGIDAHAGNHGPAGRPLNELRTSKASSSEVAKETMAPKREA